MNPYRAKFIIKNFTTMHNHEMAKILNVSLPCVDNDIRKLKDQGKLPKVKPSVLLEQIKDLPPNEGDRDDMIRSLRGKGFSYAGIVKLLNINISRQRAEQICNEKERNK